MIQMRCWTRDYLQQSIDKTFCYRQRWSNANFIVAIIVVILIQFLKWLQVLNGWHTNIMTLDHFIWNNILNMAKQWRITKGSSTNANKRWHLWFTRIVSLMDVETHLWLFWCCHCGVIRLLVAFYPLWLEHYYFVNKAPKEQVFLLLWANYAHRDWLFLVFRQSISKNSINSIEALIDNLLYCLWLKMMMRPCTRQSNCLTYVYL